MSGRARRRSPLESPYKVRQLSVPAASRRTVEVRLTGRTMLDLSTPVPEGEEPRATEAALREHADGLRDLAARHGILELRIAGPGRLVGRLANDRDLFDVADFETEASTLLGAEVELFSDRVLGNANVSPDLPTATPL